MIPEISLMGETLGVASEARAVRHRVYRPCPLAGVPIPGDYVFSDPERYAVTGEAFNACRACQSDQPTRRQRLLDFERQRGSCRD